MNSIRLKIMLPLMLIITLIFGSLIVIVSRKTVESTTERFNTSARIIVDGMYNLLDMIYRELDEEREKKLADTRQDLRELTDVALSVLRRYDRLHREGRLSLDEAQSRALAEIRELRYGDNGYYWIDNSDYILQLLPPNPSAEGMYRADLTDKKGTRFVKELVDGALRDGVSYVEYHFPKPGGEKPLPKLGCTLHFEPWDWIIGTGVYIDDIDAGLKADRREKLARFNQTLAQISYYDSYGYVKNKNSVYIAHKDPNKIGKRITTEDALTGMDVDDYLRSVGNGPVRYATAMTDGRIYKRLGYVRRFEKEDLIIVFSVHEEKVTAMIAVIRNMIIIAGGLALLLFFLIILLILNRTMKPLHAMDDILRDIAEGEGDLTRRIRITQKDEIGRIAASFNLFTDKISDTLRELKGVGDSSKAMGEDLAANITEISASSTEMAATIRSLNDQVETQYHSIENSAAKVEAIQGHAAGVRRNVETEKNALEESSGAVTQMIASLRNLSGISADKRDLVNTMTAHADDGRSAMEETARDIEGIASSVHLIQELVDVINGVSDQINLLSMNAAIEAAHAGEAGRGFAVVAEEIRKLADATGEQSSRIAQSIDQITEKITTSKRNSQETERSIDHITSSIDEIADAFNELVRGMEELSAGSGQITVSLTELKESSDAVMDSVNRMEGDTDRLSSEIRNVQDISSSNTRGIHEVMEGTNQIAEVINGLAQMGGRNRENIATMDEKIRQFRLDEDELPAPAESASSSAEEDESAPLEELPEEVISGEGLPGETSQIEVGPAEDGEE